jgi:hypothetical protein
LGKRKVTQQEHSAWIGEFCSNTLAEIAQALRKWFTEDAAIAPTRHQKKRSLLEMRSLFVSVRSGNACLSSNVQLELMLCQTHDNKERSLYQC